MSDTDAPARADTGRKEKQAQFDDGSDSRDAKVLH